MLPSPCYPITRGGMGLRLRKVYSGRVSGSLNSNLTQHIAIPVQEMNGQNSMVGPTRALFEWKGCIESKIGLAVRFSV